MPYSGADVLAHLSELARQSAALPRLSNVVIIAKQQGAGDVVKSGLRAVIGYEALISVSDSVAEAAVAMKQNKSQIAFFLDESERPVRDFTALLNRFRSVGFSCPLVFISSEITPQIKSQFLVQGALDVLHRDEVCGLRLRECLLKLAQTSHAT